MLCPAQLLLEFDELDNWEYQLHDDGHDANTTYGKLDALASANVNQMRKNKVPIESGICRSSYNRNGPGDGIVIDTLYHEPDEYEQTQSSKELFHKRRLILVQHFSIMQIKRLLNSMLR